MKTPAIYALGLSVAIAAGMVASNEWADRSDRLALEAAKARPITDDLVIHRVIVPDHAFRTTPIVTITYHARTDLIAGFGAAVVAADGAIYCSNTSGKGGGLTFPARITPAIRLSLSKFTGGCELPPGRYTLALRFNVQTGPAVKPISVETEPFRVGE